MISLNERLANVMWWPCPTALFCPVTKLVVVVRRQLQHHRPGFNTRPLFREHAHLGKARMRSAAIVQVEVAIDRGAGVADAETAGGAEWLFDQDWSAKIEYQFVNLGTETEQLTALVTVPLTNPVVFQHIVPGAIPRCSCRVGLYKF
jgi:hypothetical protein